MRRTLSLLTLALLTAAAQAQAAGTIIVSPVYAQLVALAVPADFKAGFEVDDKGSYLLELTPKAETVDAWTQMITLSGGKGLAGKIAVVDVATQLAQGYQAACPDTFSARTLPVPQIKGAAEAFAGYLGCGDTGGQSEAMVFVVLKGAEDIYTLQWAERGPAQTKPMEPDPLHWRPRADTLALARVCAKVPGEQAPYPSCTQ